MTDRLPIPAGTSVSEAVQKILDEATDEDHLRWALNYIDARYRPHTEAIQPDEVIQGEVHLRPEQEPRRRTEARLRVATQGSPRPFLRPAMDQASRELWNAMREALGE